MDNFAWNRTIHCTRCGQSNMRYYCKNCDPKISDIQQELADAHKRYDEVSSDLLNANLKFQELLGLVERYLANLESVQNGTGKADHELARELDAFIKKAKE